MAQRTTEIIGLLEDALLTKRKVSIHTIDKKILKGIIAEIHPATVKPYQERSTVIIETPKGAKRVQEYAITKIAWA
ncbi:MULTISPECIES: hypothetical protein [unclassified Lacticaseibacillus]|uniref:hypothetical protein n=1 Tax=unclassified Lacticaseibacillus TaxID=2759744 RepID=UPI0019441CE9|nr:MULTISPECIES: hypothetical protein [unclassified Lacticaseibacillus]